MRVAEKGALIRRKNWELETYRKSWKKDRNNRKWVGNGWETGAIETYHKLLQSIVAHWYRTLCENPEI